MFVVSTLIVFYYLLSQRGGGKEKIYIIAGISLKKESMVMTTTKSTDGTRKSYYCLVSHSHSLSFSLPLSLCLDSNLTSFGCSVHALWISSNRSPKVRTFSKLIFFSFLCFCLPPSPKVDLFRAFLPSYNSIVLKVSAFMAEQIKSDKTNNYPINK